MARRFGFDLGALLWLIAIFCVCLVVIPAMLEKLEQLLPRCLFIQEPREPAPTLTTTAIED